MTVEQSIDEATRRIHKLLAGLSKNGFTSDAYARAARRMRRLAEAGLRDPRRRIADLWRGHADAVEPPSRQAFAEAAATALGSDRHVTVRHAGL